MSRGQCHFLQGTSSEHFIHSGPCHALTQARVNSPSSMNASQWSFLMCLLTVNRSGREDVWYPWHVAQRPAQGRRAVCTGLTLTDAGLSLPWLPGPPTSISLPRIPFLLLPLALRVLLCLHQRLAMLLLTPPLFSASIPAALCLLLGAISHCGVLSCIVNVHSTQLQTVWVPITYLCTFGTFLAWHAQQGPGLCWL